MVFRLGDWAVDPDTRRLTRGTEEARLPPKAMAVLRALHRAGGKVLTRAALLAEVWPDVTVGEEVLTHAVAEIRKALGDSRTRPHYIETVQKAGYRLLMVETESELVEMPIPQPVGSQAAPLEEPTNAATTAALGGPLAIGERKQVTVLFAEIGASAERTGDIDPELMHKLLDIATDIISQVVHRYEGTVSKVMGDGVMVLFGAPLAHEDHAVRACHAALAVQDAVRQNAGAVERRCGVDLRLRIGINSGEVVVQAVRNDLTLDYNAIGLTTTLAADVARLSEPGTARLTHNTIALAEGMLETRPSRVIAADGKATAGDVFELVDTLPTRTRFQAAVARGLTRFVGREFEIGVLERAASQAWDAQGQIVAVIGEPGVGKSRLLHEFIRALERAGWLILQSGAVSYGRTAAHLPAIDLIRSYLKIESCDDAATISRKAAERLQALGDDLQTILVPLLALLDVPVEAADWNELDPPDRRRRMLDAMRAMLLRHSRDQPLILVVEDLHWIDSETQSFLDALVDSLPSARLLLLVSCRPEYRHDWSARAGFTLCRIDALSPAIAGQLLNSLIGDSPDLAPFKQTLIEHTGGNPFFLEEDVRALIEMQVLRGEPGNYTAARDVANLSIPASVQGILAARLDRLPDTDKELLQKCAVIGKDVPHALLERIANQTEDALRRGLARLQAAEFLYESRLLPDRAYTFKHALTHEVAYGTLLQSQRQRYHLRIAGTLEALHADRLVEYAELLAHHFTEAGEMEHACRYWLQAGQRAVERSANGEAIEHLNRSLALLERLPETDERREREIAILLSLGVPLLGTRGHASLEAERVYCRAADLCRNAADTRSLFFATWGLWRISSARSNMREARELAARLLELAEAHSEPVLHLQAHHAHWTTLYSCGDFAATLDHVEKGLELYDAGEHGKQSYLVAGHDPSICAHLTAASALWIMGYPERARRRQALAEELAQTLGDPSSIAISLNQALRYCLRCRDADAVHCALGPLREFADEFGLVGQARWCDLVLAWASALRNEAAADVASMRSFVETDPELAGVERPFAIAVAADACGVVGLADDGLALLSRALDVADSGGVHFWDAEIHRLKGELLLGLADADEAKAETYFRQAMEKARAQDAKTLELRSATSLAGLWQRQGRRAEAYAMLEPVFAWFTEGDDTPDLVAAGALLNDLAR